MFIFAIVVFFLMIMFGIFSMFICLKVKIDYNSKLADKMLFWYLIGCCFLSIVLAVIFPLMGHYEFLFFSFVAFIFLCQAIMARMGITLGYYKIISRLSKK